MNTQDNTQFAVGDTVVHPEYKTGTASEMLGDLRSTVVGLLEEGTMVTVYQDSIPLPCLHVGVEFHQGVRMLMAVDRLVRDLQRS